MNKIFVTGGCGFVGSHLVEYLFKKYKKSEIIVYDKITYAANLNNLKKIREMTLEQEALLNQNIWSKLRVKLPLSPGEKSQLRKLKEKGVYSNNLSAKNIKIRNSIKFKVLRHKCK